ncbi:MAG: YfcE family phosphodiesterase [Erysipelotrichaceae bacterium]|nr:YfcE family phosphodiesterase [Erysipelotrichaceae bacterium]
MLKLVVVSDNHGRLEPVLEVLNKHQHADGYYHCGDFEIPLAYLNQFAVVCGNNDYADVPMSLIVNTPRHRILVLHGHRYATMFSIERLVQKAKAERCNMVFYGHTHVFNDQIVDGIRFINPGSLSHNRDGSRPSYAIVEIDEHEVRVIRHEIDSIPSFMF